VSAARIVAVSKVVPRGYWTSYAEVGEVVYGHRHGGQAVGNVLRAQGHVDSAHRTLRADGAIASDWRGVGGGPEECIRRLRQEGVWDERRGRARPDRFLDANALRARGA
jgi:alkylated DNA nucleotide flippase Atl1